MALIANESSRLSQSVSSAPSNSVQLPLHERMRLHGVNPELLMSLRKSLVAQSGEQSSEHTSLPHAQAGLSAPHRSEVTQIESTTTPTSTGITDVVSIEHVNSGMKSQTDLQLDGKPGGRRPTNGLSKAATSDNVNTGTPPVLAKSVSTPVDARTSRSSRSAPLAKRGSSGRLPFEDSSVISPKERSPWALNMRKSRPSLGHAEPFRLPSGIFK